MQREFMDFQEVKYIEHAQKHANARGLFAELENVTAAALGCSRSTVSRILKRCAGKKNVHIITPAHYDKATGKQTLNIIWPHSEPCASVNTDELVENKPLCRMTQGKENRVHLRMLTPLYVIAVVTVCLVLGVIALVLSIHP
jgi:hypothetical protein